MRHGDVSVALEMLVSMRVVGTGEILSRDQKHALGLGDTPRLP